MYTRVVRMIDQKELGEDKIRMRGADGKDYVVNKIWVLNWLGISGSTYAKSYEIEDLKNRVNILESIAGESVIPYAKEQVLNLLKNGRAFQIGKLYSRLGLSHYWRKVDVALKELVLTGKITRSKNGWIRIKSE
jgi:hypothetical protein